MTLLQRTKFAGQKTNTFQSLLSIVHLEKQSARAQKTNLHQGGIHVNPLKLKSGKRIPAIHLYQSKAINPKKEESLHKSHWFFMHIMQN